MLEWPRRYAEIYRHFYCDSSLIENGKNSNANAGVISGILFHGPPGTGKTLLAKNIGNILKCNLVTLSIPQVIRGEIGRGEREVQTALLEAQRLAPSVLFIDEFQAIFTARDGDSSSEGGSDVGQSLSTALATAFDTINRWNAHAGARNFILIIGATNEPWAVDKGFLRRDASTRQSS